MSTIATRSLFRRFAIAAHACSLLMLALCVAGVLCAPAQAQAAAPAVAASAVGADGSSSKESLTPAEIAREIRDLKEARRADRDAPAAPGWRHPRTIILVLLGVGMFAVAFRRLRQQKLKERHALVMLFAACPFLILAAYPRIIDWTSARLSISYETVMLMCVSLFFMFLIFELLTIVSLQERRIATLAQMTAILMEKQRLTERHDNPALATPPHDQAPSKLAEVAGVDLPLKRDLPAREEVAAAAGSYRDQIPMNRINR